MAKRRIDDNELYAHFITFSCYHRRRLLDSDQAKRIVLGVLNDELKSHSAKCVGFVIMPDHVHAIVWFPKSNQLSHFVKEWKRKSSSLLNEFIRSKFPHYTASFSDTEPIWQPKYYVFHIYTQHKLREKVTYMHMNPVRAGLVERDIDWPWSSARWYAFGKSVGVPIHWIE
jgi:putative transposase